MIHLRLLRLARSVRGWVAVAVVVGVSLSAVAVAQAAGLAWAFTQIVAGATLPALLPALGVVGAALLIRPALTASRELVAHRVAGGVATNLRGRIVDAEHAAGPLAQSRARSGHRQSLLVDGVENLQPYFSRYVPQFAVTLLTASVVVIIIVGIDPVAGTVAGAVAVSVPLAPRLWDRVLQRRGEEHWTAYSEMNADVVDSTRGMETLKLLGAVPRHRGELVAASARLLRSTLRQLGLSLVESGLTALLLVAGPAVVLLIGVARVTSGALAPSALFAVTLLAFEVFRPFRELSNHWHAGYAGVAAGSRILTLLSVPRREDAAVSQRDAVASQSGAAFDLTDVAFRYPGSEVDALGGVSFSAAPGTTVAVVGPSGSGKSTIAALLLGLGMPDAGSVTIDGLPASALRETVSLVSQDPIVFAGTLRENLQLVAPAADDDALTEALRAAGAADLLDPRRGGLDAAVGDAGALLSGGQRQRLAIARALLQDRPLLVLDEASSALDASTEQDVFGRLLGRSRADGSAVTVVIIAHRLAAIRDADEVIVLDDGRVVEHGVYDELLAGGGLLSRLHAAQHDGVIA